MITSARPPTPANRLGLDYRAEAAKLGRPVVPIIDAHTHIHGETAADFLRLSAGVSLAEVEKEAIRATLALHNGNKTRAAEVLGIGRKTLHRKLQEYGL